MEAGSKEQILVLNKYLELIYVFLSLTNLLTSALWQLQSERYALWVGYPRVLSLKLGCLQYNVKEC